MFDDHWRIYCRNQDSAEKKDRQDTIFRKIRKFQKNTRKLYVTRRLKKPEGGGKRSHRVGTHTGGVA
jgi:hypothetical protein